MEGFRDISPEQFVFLKSVGILEFSVKIYEIWGTLGVHKIQFSVYGTGCGFGVILTPHLQEMFTKKERELAKLRRDCAAHAVAAGKLTTQQSDWLANEMTQKHEAARRIFADALSQRLTAVAGKKAKRKCLVEFEVRK